MNQYKSYISAPNGFGVGETIHISKPLKYESVWWRWRAWYLIDVKPFLVSGDRWMQFFARRLPRRLCYWVFIRVWGWNCWNEDMDTALFSRILDAWEREH